jgi:hypothetical protein
MPGKHATPALFSFLVCVKIHILSAAKQWNNSCRNASLDRFFILPVSSVITTTSVFFFFFISSSPAAPKTPRPAAAPKKAHSSFGLARPRLSVRLLVPGAGAGTTELLGLAAAVVSDQQGAVELDKGLLEQVLGVLVDVLLVVGDEGLGDGLADGVDLGGVTTTGDTDADVDVGELVEADNQEGLVNLER